jgi:hypothetical protein
VLPELTYEFREEYRLLLRARPGLTDPASLKYCQETRLLAGAPDPMRFFKAVVTPDKIRISGEYMSRANLWTDSVTLAMTAVICCFPSMSRVYGEAPEIPGAAVPPESPEFQPILAFAPQADECAFSPELALLDAAGEEMPQQNALPWIPLQEGRFMLRSASQSAEDGPSHL